MRWSSFALSFRIIVWFWRKKNEWINNNVWERLNARFFSWRVSTANATQRWCWENQRRSALFMSKTRLQSTVFERCVLRVRVMSKTSIESWKWAWVSWEWAHSRFVMNHLAHSTHSSRTATELSLRNRKLTRFSLYDEKRLNDLFLCVSTFSDSRDDLRIIECLLISRMIQV